MNNEKDGRIFSFASAFGSEDGTTGCDLHFNVSFLVLVRRAFAGIGYGFCAPVLFVCLLMGD